MELITGGADPNAMDDMGEIPALVKAADQGHTGVVEALLQTDPATGIAQIDLDKKWRSASGKISDTALMIVSRPSESGLRENAPEIVAMLLEGGADVNAVNDDGTTALMCAAGYGEAGIVAQLLGGGANPTMICTKGDWNGTDALGMARHMAEMTLAEETAAVEDARKAK